MSIKKEIRACKNKAKRTHKLMSSYLHSKNSIAIVIYFDMCKCVHCTKEDIIETFMSLLGIDRKKAMRSYRKIKFG